MAAKKIYNVIDVESAGDLGFPLIYDFAWQIQDKQGNILQTKNYLVREVFTNRALMCDAYFADKYFSVYPDLLAKGLQIKSLHDIISEFTADWQEYKVTTFCAYNAGFDLTAMLCTWLHCAKHHGLQIMWPGMKFRDSKNCNESLSAKFEQFARYLEESEQLKKEVRQLKHNVCFDTEILDIYMLCAQRLMSTKRFQKTALANLWITPNGNFSTTAECAWRYFTEQPDFVEHHTSMEDVIIEGQLLAAMLKQKKKLPLNKLDPACMVSRVAQPNGKFFHERHQTTWTNWLNERFLETMGFSFDDFIGSGSFFQWQIILKDSFLKKPENVEQRAALAKRFFEVTGMTYRDWQKLPDNFKKRQLLEIYGAEWYEIEPQLEEVA